MIDQKSFNITESPENINSSNIMEEAEVSVEPEITHDIDEDVLNIETPVIENSDIDVVDPDERVEQSEELDDTYEIEKDDNSIEWSLFDSDEKNLVEGLTDEINVKESEINNYTE